MSGVFRPYTLVDVLGTLNQQNGAQQDQTTNGLGDFAEVDETLGAIDSMTTTLQVGSPTWDNGQWGSFTWG
jgi:hypothetical protein